MSFFSTIELTTKHIVIFDLPAVVSYEHLPLRKALINVIEMVLEETPLLQDIDWTRNGRGVLYQIYENTLGRIPSDVEVLAVKAAFDLQLKEYFLEQDEPFDVWPGIQNIFESLDKRDDWDYLIISDYWLESTRFILSSCGIFSGKIKLLTSDDGLKSSEIIKELGQSHERNGLEVLYLLARDIKIEDSPQTRIKWEQIAPPIKKRADLVEYPRFSKLFS